jgi:hypothetical protein
VAYAAGVRGPRGLSVVAVAGLVLAACGGIAQSQSTKHHLTTGAEIANATAAADSAKVTVRSRATFSGDRAALAIDASGRVDFALGNGDLVMRASPSTSPDSPNEVRWIGDITYTKGSAGPGVGHVAPDQWARVDAAKVRAESHCAGASAAQTFPNPTDLLAVLRSNLSLTDVGAETINGVNTTHWRAHNDHRNVTTDCWTGKTSTGSPSNEAIDVWVDAQQRARRFETAATITDSASGESTTTINQQTTVEFSDFGIPVDVQAPPESQVVDITDATIGDHAGPGTVSADGWHDVHGTVDGKTWHVWTARSSTGWFCFDAADTPQSFGDFMTLDGYPKHNGHSAAWQLIDQIPDNPPFDGYVVLHDTTGWVIVGSIGTSGDVHVVLTDGTRIAVAVDPTTELLDWHGTRNGAAPKRIEVGATACRLDGGGHSYDGNQSETSVMEAIRAGTIACAGVATNIPADIGQIAGTPLTLPTKLRP